MRDPKNETDPKKRVVLRQGASHHLQVAAADINAFLDWCDIEDELKKEAGRKGRTSK